MSEVDAQPVITRRGDWSVEYDVRPLGSLAIQLIAVAPALRAPGLHPLHGRGTAAAAPRDAEQLGFDRVRKYLGAALDRFAEQVPSALTLFADSHAFGIGEHLVGERHPRAAAQIIGGPVTF